ncbi:MAG: hypothetical protein GY851_03000, partial [bacterium]|nr:hypothetical protein [bacterium]
GDARAVAFDAATGDVVWQDTEIAFGSWLGYSDEHDLLLQATRNSSDMVRGEEGKRMVVYRAADGVVAWDVERGYSDPPILHGGHIITYGAMHSLFTGEPVTRANPLTDKPIPWRYERTKGCGYHIACESMLTFRSSAAAFYDLAADGGTGHFGGFKSGCSVNLIAADGVLNAPDYTRTCRCSYQNQSSLAFVHMPEVEVWTTYPRLNIDGRIQRLGLNLGAPGDRKAHDGMLWLEYPAEGGASPGVEIAIEPETPERFLRHSSCMEGDGLGWIGASGIEGLTRLKITLANGDTAKKMEPYRVRLYFAEMGDAGPGDRVMTVRVQGKKVLDDFDVVQEAGGPRRTLVREFEGVNVKDALEIELAQSGDANLGPILSGIEILAE